MLFRKLNPINVQEGCVVANRRAAVEISDLRSYPLALLHFEWRAELHVFLAVETIVELCRRGNAIANASTLHHGTHIDVLSGMARLGNVIHGIFLGIGLLLFNKSERQFNKCLLLAPLHSILAVDVTKETTVLCGDKLNGGIVLTLDDKSGFFTLVFVARIRYELQFGCHGEVLGGELLHQGVLHVSEVVVILWLLNAIKTELGFLGIAEIPIMAVWALKLPLQS